VDLIFEIAGDQIDGARDYQEDAFLTTYIDDEAGESKSSALVIMADGMGGHAAGNIASNLVVSTFNKFFTGRFGKEPTHAILRAALDKANDALRESIRETPALDGMGCTMVTAAFTQGKLYWVSVGDSHLYLVRDGKLIKKNDDHSYGGYLDRMQAMGMDVEPEQGLSRNMLMSAMTGGEIDMVDCPEEPIELQPGDRVIVSSDGLDTLDEEQILEVCSWAESAKQCVDGLLRAVEHINKPRQDNTTVICVDVLERTPAPSAAAPEPAPEPEHEDDTEPSARLATGPGEETSLEAEEGGARGGLSKGLLGAVAGLLLAAVAAGGYFLLGGKGEPAPPPPAAQPAAPAPAPAPAGAPTPGPAPASPPAAAQPAAEPAAPAPPAAPAAAGAGASAAVPAAAPAREFRDRLSSGGEGPPMVRIPGGTFEMGSSGLSTAADERPRHKVTIAPFAIGKYEVTFAEYERFARATGRRVPDNLYLEKSDHPVIFVSWDDAYAYTRWLTEQTGKKYRLPTEAEWEYAARAGTTTPYWWGYDIGENRAHCFDCKTGLNPRLPTRIGRFEPNPFGLYDTAGNVYEWVHDCYHPNYKGAPNDGSVWEGGDCTYRVTRGGSYSSTSKSLRVTARRKWRSTQGYDSVGFRVAREP